MRVCPSTAATSNFRTLESPANPALPPAGTNRCSEVGAKKPISHIIIIIIRNYNMIGSTYCYNIVITSWSRIFMSQKK